MIPPTGRGVRVAVIDSGIHADHPHVRGVAGGTGFALDGTETSDYTDRIGHGTAVGAAIREKAPAVDLFAVKVFDRSLATEIGVLVRAIDWAIERSVHIVNLSLGTAVDGHDRLLQPVVNRARERGVLIVAASAQDGVRWLPGSLPGVVAVELDWSCPRSVCRVLRSSDSDGTFVLRASGFPRDIPGVPPEKNLKGLSFAVANVSGLLACALEGVDRPALDRVPDLLRLGAPSVAP